MPVFVPVPGVMPFGFRLIFLCWPLDPDSQAEAVSAGSQHTSVSGYKSSWKNSFCRPGIKLRESDLLKERPHANASHVHRAAVLPHLDPGHFEGHRLNGGLGEHQSYSYLHVTHVALGLRQKSQTLKKGTKEDEALKETFWM